MRHGRSLGRRTSAPGLAASTVWLTLASAWLVTSGDDREDIGSGVARLPWLTVAALLLLPLLAAAHFVYAATALSGVSGRRLTLREATMEYDDDMVDVVAAVVAEEMTQQLHVRRELPQIAELVAIELLRNFRIQRTEGTADFLPPVWPLLAYVRIDNGDRAHLELARLHWSTGRDDVEFALPKGGVVTVRCGVDGSVEEIVLSPASRLLPGELR